MKYPDKIYNKFEIVEKTICGEKHYGLVQVYRVLGFNLRKRVKIRTGFCQPLGSIDSWGQRWVNRMSYLENAIEKDNAQQEYKFRKRKTK